jgi:hypothetical protein
VAFLHEVELGVVLHELLVGVQRSTLVITRAACEYDHARSSLGEFDKRMETAKKACKAAIRDFTANRNDSSLAAMYQGEWESAQATVVSLQRGRESLVEAVDTAQKLCSTISEHLRSAVGLVRFSLFRLCFAIYYVLLCSRSRCRNEAKPAIVSAIEGFLSPEIKNIDSLYYINDNPNSSWYSNNYSIVYPPSHYTGPRLPFKTA